MAKFSSKSTWASAVLLSVLGVLVTLYYYSGRHSKLPDSESEPLNYVIYPHVEIDGKNHKNVRKSFYLRDCDEF